MKTAELNGNQGGEMLRQNLQKKLKALESRIATLEAKAKTGTELGAIGQMKFLAREYRRNIESLN